MTKAPLYSHAQIISAYPSCEDCVSWSEAGIAIAGGENVYFASNRDAQSLHDPNDGRIQVLRVDQFDRDEWPDAPMATLTDLSIGEEQSESVVAALAWSSPGLGIHRRCVLAVLTSNLVLSLWETDGSRNSWKRTCVINNHVDKSDMSAVESRKSIRLRAFVWLPPIKQTSDDRWGVHLLLTADDEKTMTLWRISKQEKQMYGSWLIQPVAKGKLPDSSLIETPSMTALQLSLIRAQRVNRFIIDTWQPKKDAQENCSVLQAKALFNNSPSLNPIVSVRVQVSFHENSLAATLASGYKASSRSGDHGAVLNNFEHPLFWEKQLEGIHSEYRRKFQLLKIRTRFWGFAQSPNRQRVTAIVTLHPQESYEYTTANTEKSWLLFGSLTDVQITADEEEQTLHEVRRTVLAHILGAVRDRKYSSHELDSRLLKVWTAWTEQQEGLNGEHKDLSSILDARATERNELEVQASDTQTSSTIPVSNTAVESCSLCHTSFTTDIDAEYAVCEMGHQFSRCTLSLLAIQEPRISKFCSKCERQYLSLNKLGPLPSDTLIAELFDKFDVCPVCEGKYRS